MTKVCHMTSAHGPEDVRIFHKECVSLARAGYETYLVQPGGSYEKNGVHLVGLGEVTGGRLKRMTQVAHRAYEAALSVDADIYHFHDPELLPYGLKLKKRGKKVIFDSHEIYVEQMREKYYLPRLLRIPIASCYGAYERHVLKRLDGLIFIATLNGEYPYPVAARHFAYVNNTPLLDELYDHYDPAVPKWERSVCYVGGLTLSRGIMQMVQAAGKTDCTLYLGGNYIPASCQAEAEALPGYAHVRYLGQLNRPQVADTLLHCQVGLCVVRNIGEYNRYDNLLTKVHEYMALGLPVVLTWAPYNKKMMERYQFGLCVDAENPDEIANAVTWLLDHPEEARRMGENGRKAVKEEFNWGVEEKKLLALYEEILNDK